MPGRHRPLSWPIVAAQILAQRVHASSRALGHRERAQDDAERNQERIRGRKPHALI